MNSRIIIYPLLLLVLQSLLSPAISVYSQSRQASTYNPIVSRLEKQKKTWAPTSSPTATFNPTLSSSPTQLPTLSTDNMITISPSFTLYVLSNSTSLSDRRISKVLHGYIMDYLYILEQSYSSNEDTNIIKESDISLNVVNKTTIINSSCKASLLRGASHDTITKLTFSVSFKPTMDIETDDDNYNTTITKEMISNMNIINTNSSEILKYHIIEKAMLFWSDNVFGTTSVPSDTMRYYDEQKYNILKDLEFQDISTMYFDIISILKNCNSNQTVSQVEQPPIHYIKDNTRLYDAIFITCIVIIILLGSVIIGYLVKKNKLMKDRFHNNTLFVTRTITETSSSDTNEVEDTVSTEHIQAKQAFRKSTPKRKKKKLPKKKNSPIKNISKNKLTLSLPTINEVSTYSDSDDSNSDDSEDMITGGVTTLLYEDDGFITDDVVNLSALQFVETDVIPTAQAITQKLIELSDTVNYEDRDDMDDASPMNDDDISYISDISSTEEIPQNYQELQIIAPAGHLHLDISSNANEACYIHNIQKESPLYNIIQINDLIMKIDDVNVVGWNAVSISMLLSSRAALERVITLHRLEDDTCHSLNTSSSSSCTDVIFEYD